MRGKEGGAVSTRARFSGGGAAAVEEEEEEGGGGAGGAGGGRGGRGGGGRTWESKAADHLRRRLVAHARTSNTRGAPRLPYDCSVGTNTHTHSQSILKNAITTHARGPPAPLSPHGGGSPASVRKP